MDQPVVLRVLARLLRLYLPDKRTQKNKKKRVESEVTPCRGGGKRDVPRCQDGTSQADLELDLDTAKAEACKEGPNATEQERTGINPDVTK